MKHKIITFNKVCHRNNVTMDSVDFHCTEKKEALYKKNILKLYIYYCFVSNRLNEQMSVGTYAVHNYVPDIICSSITLNCK